MALDTNIFLEVHKLALATYVAFRAVEARKTKTDLLGIHFLAEMRSEVILILAPQSLWIRAI